MRSSSSASSGPPVATMRPARQHVDDVGLQLVEQAAVVGDGQHAEAVVVRQRLDAPGHGPQGVDVEAGVDLVEHGELGVQHRQLQRLVALALAAGQVDVEGPGEEALVEADAARLGRHQLAHLVRDRARRR